MTPDSDVTSSTPERQAALKNALAKLPPGANVLDLGAGRGHFTAFLQSLGFSAIGVDISQVSVSAARAKYPNLRFELATPEGGIPFEDSFFDAVWCSEVIEHVFDVHAFLSEINRSLKPDGLLVLTTPHHGRIKNLLISLFKFDRHFDPEHPHIRYFDRAGLERCLKRAGFEPVSCQGIGRFFPVYRAMFAVAGKIGKPGPPPSSI